MSVFRSANLTLQVFRKCLPIKPRSSLHLIQSALKAKSIPLNHEFFYEFQKKLSEKNAQMKWYPFCINRKYLLKKQIPWNFMTLTFKIWHQRVPFIFLTPDLAYLDLLHLKLICNCFHEQAETRKVMLSVYLILELYCSNERGNLLGKKLKLAFSFIKYLIC